MSICVTFLLKGDGNLNILTPLTGPYEMLALPVVRSIVLDAEESIA